VTEVQISLVLALHTQNHFPFYFRRFRKID